MLIFIVVSVDSGHNTCSVLLAVVLASRGSKGREGYLSIVVQWEPDQEDE